MCIMTIHDITPRVFHDRLHSFRILVGKRAPRMTYEIHAYKGQLIVNLPYMYGP
jgi:hypothetical protein